MHGKTHRDIRQFAGSKIEGKYFYVMSPWPSYNVQSKTKATFTTKGGGEKGIQNWKKKRNSRMQLLERCLVEITSFFFFSS